MPKNWNRRFKHNRDKMKTGDIFELAEVVRNLSLRDHEKGLSTGEKQMFVKAKKILASELMYAKEMDEDEAAEWLDDVLARHGRERRRSARSRRRSRAAVVARAEPLSPSGPSSSPPAAASGSAADRPKAFAPLRGRPLLAESLERLEASDWIDAIVVVAPPGWEEPSILLAEELGCGKVVGVRDRRRDAGRVGARRASPRSADDAAVVLVHDAARPLLPEEVLERVLTALNEGWDGAVPGPAARRTRSSASSGDAGRRDAAARRARRRADAAGVRRVACCATRSPATSRRRRDCASLVEARGGRVHVVEGDPRLLKVTTPEDLALVERWLRRCCDRRLPHAPRATRTERIDHTRRGGRALRRGGRRARRRRDRLHRARLLLPSRPARSGTMPYQLERCVYDLDAYVDAVVEAKRRGLPVKLGLEVDYVPATRGRAARRCSRRYPWDYLLGSVHFVDGARGRPGAGALVDAARRRGGVAAVLRRAGAAPRAAGLFDVALAPRPGQDLRRRPDAERSLAARESPTRSRRPASPSRSRRPACTSRSASSTRTRSFSRPARARRADHARLGRARAGERRPRLRPGARARRARRATRRSPSSSGASARQEPLG